MRGLGIAVAFLTRLPVPLSAQAHADARAQAASLAWYPAVGLLLGGLLAGLALALAAQPPLLQAALLLAAWVVLTGGLHLDGLADSADAWVGGLGDRERTLAIMKDPRAGPAGVVAVVLVLLLKFAALASLAADIGLAVFLAVLLARMALTALFLVTPYVRGGGLGSALASAPRAACVVALLLGGIVCLLADSVSLVPPALVWQAPLQGAAALVAAGAVFALWRRAGLRRIGGCTGDTAGALAEAVETAVLVILALNL